VAEITILLRRYCEGEPAALDALMPLVYDELRRIARSFLRRQRPGHTLQPTALINEAFLKMFAGAKPRFSDRAHFLALMARVMRQVLVDYARSVGAAKRGGGAERVSWDTNVEIPERGSRQQLKMLELHHALDALAREDERLAQIVEMHYFAGMTAEETAEVVKRSAHRVRHDLRLARAWLRREINPTR